MDAQAHTVALDSPAVMGQRQGRMASYVAALTPTDCDSALDRTLHPVLPHAHRVFATKFPPLDPANLELTFSTFALAPG